MTRLESLSVGQQIPYGGDRVAVVDAALAEAFRPGDRIVVDHDTGMILHIPVAQHELVSAAIADATAAFHQLQLCSDDQISTFFEQFAINLDTPDINQRIRDANDRDVSVAQARQRSVTRLQITDRMMTDMSAGLRAWAESPTRRGLQRRVIDHVGWSVAEYASPLGVVGFVFEGRPNVFADAAGVLRTGNTTVMRIGSDALGTAKAIMDAAVRPALDRAGLPPGVVQLIDSTAHAAGWALFADRRVGLAIARGSGPAVAQLGAVAAQHGVPVSLHGTGGAWLVVAPDADPDQLFLSVRHSLDRKVCNTMNVCCVVNDPCSSNDSAQANAAIVQVAAHDAAASRGVTAIVHVVDQTCTELGHEWEWEDSPEFWLVNVDSIDQAVELFNTLSPKFAATLVSSDQGLHDRFYEAVDAPFVGNGFTRWVDGQFALALPELGLSNWQNGRLLARGGVLSGDSVFTVRLRADITDFTTHR